MATAGRLAAIHLALLVLIILTLLLQASISQPTTIAGLLSPSFAPKKTCNGRGKQSSGYRYVVVEPLKHQSSENKLALSLTHSYY